MRPLPILAAAAAYWLLGALWYSALFAGAWTRGLQAQGIALKDPTPAQLRRKLTLTFVATLATATAMAWLLSLCDVTTVGEAAPIGLVAGLGLGGAALAVAYTWESKPLAVYLVDASYHALGPTVVAIILGAWA
jgi:hypothetical protein